MGDQYTCDQHAPYPMSGQEDSFDLDSVPALVQYCSRSVRNNSATQSLNPFSQFGSLNYRAMPSRTPSQTQAPGVAQDSAMQESDAETEYEPILTHSDVLLEETPSRTQTQTQGAAAQEDSAMQSDADTEEESLSHTAVSQLETRSSQTETQTQGAAAQEDSAMQSDADSEHEPLDHAAVPLETPSQTQAQTQDVAQGSAMPSSVGSGRRPLPDYLGVRLQTPSSSQNQTQGAAPGPSSVKVQPSTRRMHYYINMYDYNRRHPERPLPLDYVKINMGEEDLCISFYSPERIWSSFEDAVGLIQDPPDESRTYPECRNGTVFPLGNDRLETRPEFAIPDPATFPQMYTHFILGKCILTRAQRKIEDECTHPDDRLLFHMGRPGEGPVYLGIITRRLEERRDPEDFNEERPRHRPSVWRCVTGGSLKFVLIRD